MLRNATPNFILRQISVFPVRDAPQVAAPEPRHDGPVHRIRHHVRGVVSMLAEIETYIRGNEAVRPRVPVERKLQQMPNGAARTVRPNEPAGAHLLAPSRSFNRDGDACCILIEPDDALIEKNA